MYFQPQTTCNETTFAFTRICVMYYKVNAIPNACLDVCAFSLYWLDVDLPQLVDDCEQQKAATVANTWLFISLSMRCHRLCLYR